MAEFWIIDGLLMGSLRFGGFKGFGEVWLSEFWVLEGGLRVNEGLVKV